MEHFLHAFRVLLALLGCCVAAPPILSVPNFLRIRVQPSLDQQHIYRFNVKCPTGRDPFSTEVAEYQPALDLFEVNLGDDSQKCPVGYKIGTAIMHREQNAWSAWTHPHMSDSAALNDRNMSTHVLDFANYFKLVVSPNLAPNSKPKMLYRVDVFCAGSEQLEFKTFTQSTTTVVLRSERGKRKCAKRGDAVPEYDIRVWAIRQEWMQPNNLFDEPELVAQSVPVKNGTVYQMHFVNQFNLDISPMLLPFSDQVYYVEVKCNGREAEEIFRSYTEQNAQILFGADDCTEYDIFVSKLDKQFVQQPDKLPINAKSESKELAVKIGNGSTHTFNFIEEMSIETVADDEPQQPMERKLKRVLEEFDVLKGEFKALKTDVREVKDTLSELRQFLEKKLKS